MTRRAVWCGDLPCHVTTHSYMLQHPTGITQIYSVHTLINHNHYTTTWTASSCHIRNTYTGLGNFGMKGASSTCSFWPKKHANLCPCSNCYKVQERPLYSLNVKVQFTEIILFRNNQSLYKCVKTIPKLSHVKMVWMLVIHWVQL